MKILFVILAFLAVVTGHGVQHLRNGSSTQSIIGGTPTSGQEYPFFVAGDKGCGGSLIAEDVVLTAAHCFGAMQRFVVVGPFIYQSYTGPAQDRQIKAKVVHPNFNYDTARFDMMLVKIDPVTLPNLLPITLNSQDTRPSLGQRLTVIGFGFTSPQGPTSNRLRKTTVKALDYRNCSRAYANVPNVDYQKASMFCASAPGRGACAGDSGGPIFDSNQVQVGIVSFGYNKCSNARYPSVYARVSSSIDWIQETTCRLSDSKNLPFPCPRARCPVDTTLFDSPHATLPVAVISKGWEGSTIVNVSQVPAAGIQLAAGSTTSVVVTMTDNNASSATCKWTVQVPPMRRVGSTTMTGSTVPVGEGSKRADVTFSRGRGFIHQMRVKLLNGALKGSPNAYVRGTLQLKSGATYRSVILRATQTSAVVGFFPLIPFSFWDEFLVSMESMGATSQNRIVYELIGQMEYGLTS